MTVNFKKCGKKGGWFEMRNGYRFWVECSCVKERRFVAKAQSLGLGEDIFTKTLETYETKEDWQKFVLEKAKEFSKKEYGTFYIGGQVGSGKTHICTGLLNKFIKTKDCSYFVWNDIITKLKQTTYENKREYERMLDELKYTPVLYIDDFFKTANLSVENKISKADIDKAFQIINARYIASKSLDLITIISSEKTDGELNEIDEAIGSRIYEMADSGKFVVSIGKDSKKNYRFKK